MVAGRVTRSKFHIEDPQMLGVTVQSFVAMVIWSPGYVHPPLLRTLIVKFASILKQDKFYENCEILF